MDLFTEQIDPSKNWLPKDGVVNYFGPIIPLEEADDFFKILADTIPWEADVVHMFGKRIVTKRKVAWYGDQPYNYTYSNSTKKALPWTPTLRELKEMAENLTNETYNSCLLNLYHTGEEGMGWHTDNEKELKRNGAIASYSFGAERKFVFKHKTTKEKVELLLDHGSLLVMKGATQNHWLHRLPPTKKVGSARINLTFRTIISQ
ncbi:MAG: alpha-ketoglutarate-dependent dioxygenase AlkB [Muricauda sp.]|jgi:alkylated DNA repair dioxygenase AlkB|nr:alpha-ketoglutarate-dependent dioxygenase AlkB [Allomuricauda sp.]MBO6534367.1 alpha-ketoglutarate-dependent dioxygenase AlkB [Allomuricauda sp.]MBO6588899.1 alpha-ketoglutarate-dependent dioxygenase AlkB [Allomuricauda sp.]MBO6618524.1 alpha-ketoglutarate-dependent dioxygenase AlkB [Allomuricauda sp.]MBO6644437.1 alpha-ketoglutarate-dependent dioxygenase AlkB [Allomuricauda sp.]MBO6746337.1 alpha-ketoglutarate-dependent dioxygenase AlkB [Allomuricauda sp.]